MQGWMEGGRKGERVGPRGVEHDVGGLDIAVDLTQRMQVVLALLDAGLEWDIAEHARRNIPARAAPIGRPH